MLRSVPVVGVAMRPAQVYVDAVGTAMFTAVGKVCLTSIIGEVMVDAIDNACINCSLVVTGPADLATAVAITDDPVGQMYSVPTIGAPLNVAALFTDLHEPVILWDADEIGITITGGPTSEPTAGTDGHIQWTIRYHPMTAGAYVDLA
ncbi:hypothetical protein ES703_83388 [subsurface metagenome]